MLSFISKKLELRGVRMHVKMAQRVLNFAMITAKRAYETKPDQWPSLGAAVWDALECRPGWKRTEYDRWDFSNGNHVERYEGELISSVFLSMLIVERIDPVSRSPYRYELFEALIDEWKRQQLLSGTPGKEAEAIAANNKYVAASWLVLQSAETR